MLLFADCFCFTDCGETCHEKTDLLVFSVCLTVAAASWAATTAWAGYTAELPDPMDFGVVYEKIAFEAADTDGNNLVSEGEFARDAAAAFSGLDRNHDRKLTPDELGTASVAHIDVNGDGFSPSGK